jgi:two-component system KDP operon response regulator KdpE
MAMTLVPAGAKLLLIEDDATFAEALRHYLTAHGYEVRRAADGQEGLRLCYAWQPQLVILDVMLPKLDGWAVCARLRELSDVPIIMLSARGQEADRVRGLQGGADDYVTKPCSLRELAARIEVVLRRVAPSLAQPAGAQIIPLDGDITIDMAGRQVLKGGQPLKLTRTEWRLFFVLADNAGQIIPHERLLERVWGSEYIGNTEYLKLYIWRLRRKIEQDPTSPKYIITEHGIGHRLSLPASRPNRVA